MVDMDSGGSCVLRIVNLDDSFTEPELKSLILIKCQPQGNIKKIYLKRNYEPNIFFGYVIFEHSHDASKTIRILNGHVHISNKLEVELIGPNLPYRKYIGGQVLQPRIYRGGHGRWLMSFPPLGEANNRFKELRNIIGQSTKPGTSKYISPHLRTLLDVQNSANNKTEKP